MYDPEGNNGDDEGDVPLFIWGKICKNCGNSIIIDKRTGEVGHVDFEPKHNYSNFYLIKECFSPAPANHYMPPPKHNNILSTTACIANKHWEKHWKEIANERIRKHKEYEKRADKARNESPPVFISCDCGCTGHGMFGKTKSFLTMISEKILGKKPVVIRSGIRSR